MTFGTIPVSEALGSILAHSLRLNDGVLKKGTVLGEGHIASLNASGHESIVVAQLDPDDVTEDEAARRIGVRLTGTGLRLGPAFTGRANVIADMAGLIRVDPAQVDVMNRVDEGLTLATLPDMMRVDADQLVATVKVIPYGLPKAVVDAGEDCLMGEAIRLMPFKGGSARLVMTRTPGFKESLLAKGEEVIRARLDTLGYVLDDVVVVSHDAQSVAETLSGDADLTLILGASATSDREDVAPAAVVQAGGRIDRFGMPVDPGNLLFLGHLKGHPVVGLPGCARSPALNGVDWVLERLSARLDVTSDDIAAMGVGGLLKEMPGRPQPRRPGK